MLSFITENVWKPWTYSDVREYEQHGSQRDKIHYNSIYNSRIILSEKNVFQCSIRVNSEKYKNFYLIAIARKMFYFSIYIPQLDIIKKHSNDEFIKKCISKTRFINNFINNSTTSPSLDDDIVYVGGNTLMVKVKAQIEDFLFPKRGEISNELIIQQYKVLNNIYANVVGEYEKICSLIESYNNKLNQQIEKEQEAIKKMLVRKGVRIAASVGIAALTGIYVDLDTILGFEDLADVADVIDTSNFSFDSDIDYIDWETEPDLILSENDFTPEAYAGLEDQYNVSFCGKNCPPNARADGYIYHSEIEYKDYKVYKKNGSWWIWTEKDVWENVTKFIKKS